MKTFRHLLKVFFYRYIFRMLIKNTEKFSFNSKKYPYFWHSYNNTFSHERAIEIPIIMDYIKKRKEQRILEVGNVLSHYFETGWDVLDKYEKGIDVINQDIIQYKPSKKYNLVVSVSTIEHIGFDETPKDPKQIFAAIKNLRKILQKNGELIVTVPIGWNPYLDKLLIKKKLGFHEEYYFKRYDWRNYWKQVWTMDEIKDAQFSRPYIGANGLFIGIIHKK
jgi:hypothetical protein